MSERRHWRDQRGDERNSSFGPRYGAPPWRTQRAHSSGTSFKAEPKPKCMALSRLETISLLPPLEALTALLAEKEELLNHIKSTKILPNFLSLLYQVLSNVITSPSETDVVQILVALAGDEFFEATTKYILNLPLEQGAEKMSNTRFWADHDRFFLSVATTLAALLDMAPATGTDVLPPLIKAVVYSLTNFERQHEIRFDATVHAAFEKLSADLNQLVELHRIEEETRRRRKEQPPDNFRDIDVCPLAWEVNSRARTFLRKNIIKGPYDSVEHYLDVQFRLIREDFVAPLRDGICEFLEGGIGTKQKLSNVKMHENIRCIGMIPHQGQMGYLLQVFNPNSMRNLETSRRFMYGSLVCLTEDNFKSILFGRIIDCDSQYLSAGRLVISMTDKKYLHPSKIYTLAECSVYFEPYFHVLNALQTIRTLPMEKYLVRVCSEVENEIGGYSLSTLKSTGKELGLNSSQQDAYAAALSQEFCIIQGPPGTGKTYLSLHVTRQLINQYRGRGPILIICFTNHALDQFLEGLLDTTRNLIRVGGQSKNEALKDYNFKAVKEIELERYRAIIHDKKRYKRLSYSNEKDILQTIDICKLLESSKDQRMILNIMKSDVKEEAGVMEMIYQYRHIINFRLFNKVDPNYRNSWFAFASSDELLDWLLYQSPTEQEQYSKLSINDEPLFLKDASTVKTNVAFDADDPRNAHLLWDTEPSQHMEDYKLPPSYYFLCVKEMFQQLQNYKRKLKVMQIRSFNDELYYFEMLELYEILQFKCNYVMQQLDMLRELKEAPDIGDLNVNYGNPHAMPPKERWLLYRAWLQRLVPLNVKKLEKIQQLFQKGNERYLEINDRLDLYVFQKADVIGMTTTSAARLHNQLLKLGCKIVVVEEAAEVLEAHIVTALTPACRKLILVGDHKQLRPSTSDYNITRQYNLGISLFERMVANGVRCYTLDEQHRMRPEIAALISPSIYPILKNASKVQNYPGVVGFSNSLFFITHQHREIATGDSSKKNPFEAEYLIRLARHLVLNGYEAQKITMIAAYSGQWFEMKRIKKSEPILHEMRICILDNFQGEENDIILLSLVRNNEEGANGFLNMENRVCVALSRARHGMYIMGNMPQLVKGSAIWKKVSDVLQNNESLGEFLTVRCVNHPRIATNLREIADFDKVPSGGCQLPCESKMDCGHVCKLRCHVDSHAYYPCKEPCTKVLCDLGHVCPYPCYVKCAKCVVPKQCELPCGHTHHIPCHQLPEEYVCNEEVRLVLECGHEVDKPCHVNIDDFKCPQLCAGPQLKCGHSCSLLCHVTEDPDHELTKCMVKCNKINLGCGHECNKICAESCEPCLLKVTKTIAECGHQLLWECGQEVHKGDCISSCGKQLACGHECIKKCPENCQPCIVLVTRELSCGHTTLMQCHKSVNMVPCEMPCQKKLSCGHDCTKKCFEKCDPCEMKVNKKIDECGHNRMWECGKELRKLHCNKRKCGKALACGHMCSKMCAKDCYPCLAKVTRELSCGHVQLMECDKNINSISCKGPCQKKLPCGHICKNMCFQTCGPCKVMVLKKVEGCGHEIMWECKKEVLERNCTTQKCLKVLPCGHECIKACRENCQPCRVKEMRELTCGHSQLVECHQAIKDVKCRNPCEKKLPCEHDCTKKCFEKCIPCEIQMNKTIPECGHEMMWECGSEVHQWNCNSQKCPKVLPCGHECIKACRENCQPCRVKEMRELSCGHSQLLECHQAIKNVRCTNPCAKKLPCGHRCIRDCGKCANNCQPCIVEVKKTFSECAHGHEMGIECSKEVLHCYMCEYLL